MPDQPTKSPKSDPPAQLPPTPPPSRVTFPKLPGNVTAAAIILLVFGVLAAFGSAFSLLWGLMLGRLGGRMDFDGRGFDGGSPGAGFLMVAMLLLIGVAVAGGHLAAGWAILQRWAWGRILGLVVAGVALVVGILGLVSTLFWAVAMPDFAEINDRGGYWVEWIQGFVTAGVTFGVIVSLLAMAAYGYVLVVLARAGDVFEEPPVQRPAVE